MVCFALCVCQFALLFYSYAVGTEEEEGNSILALLSLSYNSFACMFMNKEWAEEEQ